MTLLTKDIITNCRKCGEQFIQEDEKFPRVYCKECQEKITKERLD